MMTKETRQKTTALELLVNERADTLAKGLREVKEDLEKVLVDVPNLEARVEKVERVLSRLGACLRCGVIVQDEKLTRFHVRNGIEGACVWCKSIVKSQGYKPVKADEVAEGK